MARRLPLMDFVQVHSPSLDVIHRHMAVVFCPHRLEQTGPANGAGARHHSALSRDFQLNYLQYGTDVLIEPQGLRSFLVQLPLSGRVDVRIDGSTRQYRTDECFVLSPGMAPQLAWSGDCRQKIVKIAQDRLERHLAALLGDGCATPLSFDIRAEMPRPLYWTLIDALVDACEQVPAMVASPLAVAHLEQAVMTALLLGHGHNHIGRLHRPVSPAAPHYVRRAENYIEAGIAGPIAMEDLVAAAGVSARSLFAGFRRFRGMTPMQFVRARRLERVRADLLASAEGVTVAGISQRWGFSNPGRMAADYRRRFGEYPVETLRR